MNVKLFDSICNAFNPCTLVEGPLKAMPEDILLKFFSHLNDNELLQISNVYKPWREMPNNPGYIQLFTEFYASENPQFRSKFFEINKEKNVTQTKSITFKDCKLLTFVSQKKYFQKSGLILAKIQDPFWKSLACLKLIKSNHPFRDLVFKNMMQDEFLKQIAQLECIKKDFRKYPEKARYIVKAIQEIETNAKDPLLKEIASFERVKVESS